MDTCVWTENLILVNTRAFILIHLGTVSFAFQYPFNFSRIYKREIENMMAHVMDFCSYYYLLYLLSTVIVCLWWKLQGFNYMCNFCCLRCTCIRNKTKIQLTRWIWNGPDLFPSWETNWNNSLCILAFSRKSGMFVKCQCSCNNFPKNISCFHICMQKTDGPTVSS